MEMLAYYKGHDNTQEGVSSRTGNAWRKVTAIFETIEHYPKTIAVTAFNNMCETVYQCQPGKLYRVRFDVESRSWTDPSTKQERWFTDCKCWGIAEEVPAARPGIQQQPQGVSAQPATRVSAQQSFDQPLPPLAHDEPNGDLPF